MIRTIITLLLILVSLDSICQSDALGISGNIYSCQTNEQEFFAKIWICQGDNCEPVIVHSDGRFFIKNLTSGKYVIEYDNIWNQTVADTLYLDQSLREYKICLDKFKERMSYPLLELFHDSNTIKISQSSTGCFHHTSTELTFEKRDEYIYSTIASEGIKKHAKIQSNEQLALIRDFFSKIDLVDDIGSCTTTDYYNFMFDKTNVKITDSSCDWNGFYNLKETLF